MSTLRLGGSSNQRMHEHLRSAYPEEGCGVLIGREAGEVREVVRVMPFENHSTDTRERRYLIAPEQFLAAEKEARRLGLDVIGIFHSHPDHPCRPSAFDLEHAWPYYSYVIVSIAQGEVAESASFRLREDRSGFEPESIEIAPDDGAEESGESTS